MIWKADFELKILQRVRFWNKKKQGVRFLFKSFTTRQILDWKKYNASDFDLKVLQRVRFWIEKKHNASDFDWKVLQGVRFWIE